MKLGEAARRALITLALDAVTAAARGAGGWDGATPAAAVVAHPELAAARGAFTTIHVGGALRGCLGELEPEESLAEVTARCAFRTARVDPRFEPVREDELAALRLRVSVLSEFEAIRPEEVVIGTHGLLARHRGRRGLLLPEVPVEHGWDVPAFLTQLYRKAGIEAGVPIQDVELWGFTSEIIDSD